MSVIKIDWMLEELEGDGFGQVTEQDILNILSGDSPEEYDPALVDYILEMESEWATEGNL